MAQRHASYRKALEWLAYNDDNAWLDSEEPVMSVTAALVCDLFGRADNEKKFHDDLRLAIGRMNWDRRTAKCGS